MRHLLAVSTIPPRATRSGRFRPARRSRNCRRNGAARIATPRARNSCGSAHERGRRRQGAGGADRGALSRDRRRADGGAADLQSGARRRRRGFSRRGGTGGRDRRDALVHEHRRGRPHRRAPAPPARQGETRALALPAGNVDLIVGELAGFRAARRAPRCSRRCSNSPTWPRRVETAEARGARCSNRRRRRARRRPPRLPARADGGARIAE